MPANSIEIDFLPVGENSKSGDAITMRFGNFENGKWTKQTIFVIDGGTSVSGNAIIEHVQNVYNSNKIDRVFLTHPDGDHASGLRNVLENMKVEKIWMHCPWNHWSDLKNSIHDGRITRNSFSDRMREAYQYAHEIEQIAKQNKIKILAPHQGYSYTEENIPVIKVLGPDKEFYLKQIQLSEKTPTMEASLRETQMFSQSNRKKKVFEDMTFETENLSDVHETTSPENNMSLILYLNIANTKALFTGDVGTEGLFRAIKYAESQGITLNDLDIFHVPHHGSRHNLSKGILKHIKSKYAIISCAINGEPSHPSPIVTNSLLRRNMDPYWTKGNLLSFHNGCPLRDGLTSIAAIPFTNYVEIPAV